MNKEQLMAMGLTAEQADKVMTAHKTSLDGEYIPKHRFDDVNEQLTASAKTVTERDGQLATLQASTEDAVGLQATITKLTEDNKTEAAAHAVSLTQTQVANALKLQLLADATGKPHDVNMVAGLFDLTKVTLNTDGAIIDGYKEQRESIGKDKAFLFSAAATPPAGTPPAPKGFSFQGTPPAEGATPPTVDKATSFGAGLAAKKREQMGLPAAENKTT